ncbi:MAG: transketolase [Hadesarchaea archaeon]|nr:transketolase [Hadesarchaea archaeon]
MAPHDLKLINKLSEIALNIRKNSLIMTTKAGSGHPGGCLSCADILAAIYFHQLRYDPEKPDWEERDRFILSKGHAAPALYAALAMAGFFPTEELLKLRKIGSILQGHPDMRKTPGVDASTGTLGQGLSIGVGMALAFRLDNRPNRVYVLLGDGELDEGQVWEAAMSAAHYRIDNLTAIVDYNRQQLSGCIEKVMNLEPIGEKWSAFGWHVIKIDGHNMKQILDALDEAERVRGKPTVIIAYTVKGKGVPMLEKSFLSGDCKYHGTPLSEAELAKALEELHG